MTPEQEEEVRRALASVPPVGPVPGEVAARLDARLERLQAERAAGAPHTDAGDAGRPSRSPAPRSRWPRLLVAAAVLTVVGIGLGNLLDDFGAGQLDAVTAESGGGEAAGDDQGPQALEAPREAAPSAAEGYSAAKGRPSDRMVRTAERVRLRSATLAEDVEDFVEHRLLRARAAAEGDVSSQVTEKPAPTHGLTRLFSPCVLPLTEPGDQLVAARLDGEPVTLVLRERAHESRVAQIYSCDDPSRVLDRVRLDAR